MNRRLGQEGEELAVCAARAEGYQVVQQNFRCPLGEIDLILRKGETIVFAEVKARRGLAYGEAWEAVTPVKQQRIRRIATWFVRERGLDGHHFRFDVFSIQGKPGTWQYRWFKDAF